jgi:hypothetical protein
LLSAVSQLNCCDKPVLAQAVDRFNCGSNQSKRLRLFSVRQTTLS